MDYMLAFIVGGLICVIVQILMDNTKLLPGRIMVLLVCSGAVLGAVGVYEPFCQMGRSRGDGSIAWLWKCPISRSKKSGRCRRIYWFI